MTSFFDDPAACYEFWKRCLPMEYHVTKPLGENSGDRLYAVHSMSFGEPRQIRMTLQVNFKFYFFYSLKQLDNLPPAYHGCDVDLNSFHERQFILLEDTTREEAETIMAIFLLSV